MLSFLTKDRILKAGWILGRSLIPDASISGIFAECPSIGLLWHFARLRIRSQQFVTERPRKEMLSFILDQEQSGPFSSRANSDLR